jgi:hypothetical protein
VDIITNKNQLASIDFTRYNAVYSPAILISPATAPKTLFIFGPHVSVFPDNRIAQIATAPNVVYIQPSEWARDAWAHSPLCRGLQLRILPFGVNTQKFCPDPRAAAPPQEVFVYFKRRDPQELWAVWDFLGARGITPRLFHYTDKYSENDYLDFLQHRARFGIWIGSHESQGFALLEALSCNVPLLVWNVSSMNQEHEGGLPNVAATTIPYWDGRCGEQFKTQDELHITYRKFIYGIETGGVYYPRDYVVENLSYDKCKMQFMALLNITHHIVA